MDRLVFCWLFLGFSQRPKCFHIK